MMVDRSEVFQIMKSGFGLCLPIDGQPNAILRPVVTDSDKIDPQDVDRLTRWRNEHVIRFLTEFDATAEQTTQWLINRVGPDNGKILLMVEFEGKTVGHTGLGFGNWSANYIEADAIVRGEDAPRGLMKKALQSTLSWARDSLGLVDQWVRVRSDNPAVKFYEAVGFQEVKRVPLDYRIEGAMKTWFERTDHESALASLVYMQLGTHNASQVGSKA
ncbi:GNAT family N-acetyltransferase [Maritalea myrionectae]|uniref:GNAT family N-acetyltransferase n=1 Tax=Maritalea myrionectae TaxID=454601 RepID=UPI0006855BD0|nr:GNAT family N-acetyltransferase [Maritalea myrionectae]